MIDYLDIIDEAFLSLESEIDDFKDFFSESYIGIDITSLNYIDILKTIMKGIDYECEGLELKIRALRDKLNDST